MPVCVIDVTPDSSARAMPKSMTLTLPLRSNMTLPGLMSRCTRPMSCEASSAFSTPTVTRRAASVGIAPYWPIASLIASRRPCPSISCMTMYGVLEPSGAMSSPLSYTVTMFGCSSRATAWASRRNRSLNESSRPSSLCMLFSATCRSSTLS